MRGKLFLGFVLASVGCCSAADIVSGDVTGALGPDFFFDDASVGGSDNNSSNLNRDLAGFWTAGATVTISGIGWASSSAGTVATDATVTFTDLGPDGSFGTADDVVVGTVTDDLLFSGAGEYYWDFEDEVTFVAVGSTLRMNINSSGIVRRKVSNGEVKLSVAGTAVGGTTPVVVNTATGDGFWETIAWDTGSAMVTGDLGEGDTVQIGEYRRVTYRGVPASETVMALNLGLDGASAGQGRLLVESGVLTVAGDLTVGRNASANDSFVEVEGGSLNVQGSGLFGTSAESCDGSLILSGGSCQFAGDLTMGEFARGGAMIRFHNPGAASALVVGGLLSLNRCALDLTFDENYVHVPNTTTTLVSYGSRDGQFGNFRNGDKFNCGPHRFRIDYDVTGSAGSSITITALEDYAPEATPPNIVFIFSDDQGYSDLQLNAHPEWAAKYPMPALQQIADNGARFTDAYVSAGVCHPSRCGILSGLHQQRFGTDNNLSGPSYNGLSVAVRTIPRRLQSLGYRTYGVGKWHLGDTVEYHPNVRGFDQWYGMWSGSRSYYNAPTEHQVFQDQMTPVFADEDTGYLTDRIGDKTVEFIDDHLTNHSDQPFYVYMSLTAVHGPMDLEAADARYTRLQNEFGLTANDYLNSPRNFGRPQELVDAERHELAAMTLALDENIAKVVAKVEEKGVTSNTIFLYMTDNGGAEWAQGFGGNYSYNLPLRGGKGGSMFEGSVRVPCAIQWAGTIPGNQVIETPVSSLDFMATFVNAGQAPAALRNGLDGLDLLPLLKDGVPIPADRAISFRSNGTTGGGSALRMGDWKLHNTDAGFNPVLYNLRTNIGENTNVAASHPEVFEEMKRLFLAWDSRTLVPLYGGGEVVLDEGLERTGLVGGYRLRSASAEPLFLSGPFREVQAMSQDWSWSFLVRATEQHYAPNSELLYGLGDSEERGDLIRAVVDFGSGTIRLEEGKTAASQSAPLASLPTDFRVASFDFDAGSNTLIFALGETSVSLVLSGDYGVGLSHFAVGAAAMEGEVTTLRRGSVDYSDVTTSFLDLAPEQVGLQLHVAPTDGPFHPAVETSADLSSFVSDEEVLVEPLGGGRYQITTQRDSSAQRQFFRMRFDAP